MFLSLVKKYWMEILIVLAVTITYGYIKHLKNENAELVSKTEQLQSTINEKQAYITAQNIAIEANKAEYLKNLNRLPTVLKEIDVKYKTKYETIYVWRDNNETHDCNESMQYLNHFEF